MSWRELVIIPLTLIAVVALVYYGRLQEEPVKKPPPPPVAVPVPDFSSYKDVRKKKNDFFEFLLPMIRHANATILDQRRQVEAIAKKQKRGIGLSKSERKTLLTLMEEYRVKASSPPSQSDVAQLLRRVDVVPASLVLAQAANESAWGTSRFAVKGYNFFGIWCFERGCGFTPRERDDGLTHEVARFDSVQHSVNYYLFTINTNPAYVELRKIREQKRAHGTPKGIELAEGLRRYSERGTEYVTEIQTMIRYNRLHRYTLELAAIGPVAGR